jgi:DNA-binding MarR family transcriptional regulator
MPGMSSPKHTVPVDAYVLDVLLRDLVGHDKQPAAFLVFLHLYGLAARHGWRPAAASLRHIAEATGLSKSAVQVAVQTLRRRELIVTERSHSTATPRHRLLRRWAIDSKWS